MLDHIEAGTIPEGHTFNTYAMEFYGAVRLLPLSKYLHSLHRNKRLPKIMYFRKAGELLKDTESDPEAKALLRSTSYEKTPELDFKSILLLRKTDVLSNWKKIISYFDGKGTIEELNRAGRPVLLPQEIRLLSDFTKKALDINDNELNWLIGLYRKILDEKELSKALQKLCRQQISITREEPLK